jgi:hypothetical protein
MVVLLKCMEWITPKQKKSHLNKFMVEFGKNTKDLEFFRKVIAYTDSLWDEFQYGGYIKCPISGS